MSDQKEKSSENKLENEYDESMDSHEYDGIKELNNPPPFWIMFVFIASIGFSMVYVIHNFGYPGNKMDQASRYETAISDHKEETRRRMAEESGEAYQMSQEEMIAEGLNLYLAKGCIACHGTSGEGNNIGPNLSDKFWINGCSTEEIMDVIREGRPAKGMTAYKSMMTEDQMMNLTTYIKFSLVGSDPPNPKAPQGEPCE